jgi:hypothetical protein
MEHDLSSIFRNFYCIPNLKKHFLDKEMSFEILKKKWKNSIKITFKEYIVRIELR